VIGREVPFNPQMKLFDLSLKQHFKEDAVYKSNRLAYQNVRRGNTVLQTAQGMSIARKGF